MALRTHEELNAEVDRVFRDWFPDAPERLDPDDAEQATMVQEWARLRDDTLNIWTNEAFYEFFPEIAQGTKIDPSNPEHAGYADYWNDIYHQIKTGDSGQYDWSSPPAAAGGGAGDQAGVGDPAGTADPVGIADPGSTADPAAGAGASGGGPARTIAKGDVKLSRRVLNPVVVDGASAVEVELHVQETGGADLPDNTVWVGITADPYNVSTGADEEEAQEQAYLSYFVPAIAARGEYYATSKLQVDPGHWHVTAQLLVGQDVLDDSEGDVHVTGQVVKGVDLPEGTTVDVTLEVTKLTRLSDTMYRMHFKVHNQSSTEAIPAGLPVRGLLESGEPSDTSWQDYTLTEPIAAGATKEAYLTLEGHAEGSLTAHVLLTLINNGTESDPITVDAADVAHEPEHRPAAPAGGGGAPGGAGDRAPAGGDQASGPTGDEPPDINDPHFEKEFEEWTHKLLEKGVEKGAEHIAEFALEPRGYEVVGHLVTVVGYAHDLYEIFSAVIKAFHGGLDRENGRGFVYGLIWQSLGMANIKWQPRVLGGVPDDPFHNDAELEEAFNEGVAEGRAKALEPDVKYKLGMAIASNMVKAKTDVHGGAQLLMTDLFTKMGHSRNELIDYP